MNRKKNNIRSIVIISLSLVAITLAVLSFYLYNKGPVDIESSRAISIGAGDLYRIYSKDSSDAKERYTDKILEVSGKIQSVSLNTKQQQVILLNAGLEGGFVNCTMESQADNIKVANKIIVKGICSGMGEGDADLGIMGDVYISRCYITK